MGGFVVAVFSLVAGSVLSLLAGRRAKAASFFGVTGVLVGSTAGLVQALVVLLRGQTEAIHLPWAVPLGSLHLEVDPLSAVFIAAIAVVAAAAAVYGGSYLQDCAGRKNLGASWFFFNLLVASMLLVVAARNGVLFLVGWEGMSLASFFLVMFEAEQESVRRAGWTYLAAMHLGTAFLLAMFLLAGRDAPTLDFDQLAAPPGTSGVLFVLALIGFGTKAGFFPLHVWLPEAHPAAPSHVSAVMSGVMIKTGIYGLLRMLTLLGPPPPWWGFVLLGVGCVSGVVGVSYALAQHDLKRLLAYSSMENVGIIALGMGVGLLGLSYHCPAMAAMGFAGGLLHVVNHALFKSLLFLGAGAVAHGTGIRDVDRLGGLMKRMPVTGTTFLIAAAAICGLPPLNGFVSELLIFLGATAGLAEPARSADAWWTCITVVVFGGLALIGGLAAACFTKAFGMTFLGEPRSEQAAEAHEAGPAMRGPMLVLAGLCLAIGVSAPLWPLVLRSAVAAIVPADVRQEVAVAVSGATVPLSAVALVGCALLATASVLLLTRRRMLSARRVERTVTWDCGYVSPSPRMQYTASSFVRPLAILFRLILGTQDEIVPPRGLFPQGARLHTSAPDAADRWVYQPLFFGVGWVASKFRWLQQGRIQLYVLYIALTLLVLIVWKLG